jgi:predicted Zn-dependent protease
VDEDVLREATRQDQCLQLRPGEPERLFVEGSAAPVSASSVAGMRKLVAEHPDYALAVQQLGRMLNDSGDSAGALQVLEKARLQMPKSTRTLCELGRAYFLQGDSYRARQLLEFALAANPYYASGWFYLLRLLQLSSAKDGWPWVERARRSHPRNYALALQGVRLAPLGQATPYLIELLEIFGARIAEYEEPRISAAFAEAFRSAAQREFHLTDFDKALSQACQTFARSAKLADLRAAWLRRAGKAEEAFAELARANKLRLTARTYQAEYAQEDGSIYFWQFGEHILNSGPGEPSRTTGPG